MERTRQPIRSLAKGGPETYHESQKKGYKGIYSINIVDHIWLGVKGYLAGVHIKIGDLLVGALRLTAHL